MNLHVTNDEYGLYPCEIAKRIEQSEDKRNNLMVNLSAHSKFKSDIITYIPIAQKAFRQYINRLPIIHKVVFHPYNLTSYRFLKILLKRFPDVKVYWVCWSYEVYILPGVNKEPFDTFSKHYIKNKYSLVQRGKQKMVRWAKWAVGLLGAYYYSNYSDLKKLQSAYKRINYFCATFTSDYELVKTVFPNHQMQYLPLAYLSLEQITSAIKDVHSLGEKVMVGHAASPNGNHYEALKKLHTINDKFSIFLPLAYGDHQYGNLIKKAAFDLFSTVDCLEKKIESDVYYKKLTEVGWAIINARTQQGVGNIIALLWMGVKVFLNANTSTYKDLTKWGIILFDIEKDLTEHELTNRLSIDQQQNNRNVLLGRLSERAITEYWKEILR